MVSKMQIEMTALQVYAIAMMVLKSVMLAQAEELPYLKPSYLFYFKA